MGRRGGATPHLGPIGPIVLPRGEIRRLATHGFCDMAEHLTSSYD